MSEYRLLLRAKDAYYKGQPIMTDQEYDQLEERLIEQGVEVPIGYSVDNKLELPYFMASLSKVKSYNDNIERYVTPKLDGISALWYQDKLYKRTDGVNGIDITCFAKYLKLPKVDYGVRGEIVIPKNYTEYIAQVRNKDPSLVNLRNIVAGLFNAKKYDPLIKYCHFVVYEVYIDLDQEAQLKKAKDDGFNVAPCVKRISNDEKLEKLLKKLRSIYAFKIDGLVLTDFGIHRNEQGNPTYKKAFKRDLPAIQANVKFVEWEISRYSKMTPIVHLDPPVIIDGATVRKATGHNAKFINDQNIGKGSLVMIKKGGEVIPKITVCVKHETPDFPNCQYHWDENNTEIIAINHPDLARKQCVKFFGNMKVKQFGETTVNNILSQFKIDSFEQGVQFIFNHQTFENYPGIAKKKSDTIIKSLHDRYCSLSFVELMVLTPYFHRVGLAKLESIWQYIDLRCQVNYEMLTSIKNIGQKNATTILEGLPKFYNLLSFIPQREFNWSPMIQCEGPQLIITMSGTRDATVQQICKRRGGLVKTSFTNTVNLLVVKDKSKVSTKINKANAFNIPILTVDEFIKIYS